MDNIKITTNFQEFKKQFEKEENFSLYQYFKNNLLFHDKGLNDEYENNIFQTLTSDIIGDTFEEFRNFKKFKNPFKGKN